MMGLCMRGGRRGGVGNRGGRDGGGGGRNLIIINCQRYVRARKSAFSNVSKNRARSSSKPHFRFALASACLQRAGAVSRMRMVAGGVGCAGFAEISSGKCY